MHRRLIRPANGFYLAFHRSGFTIVVREEDAIVDGGTHQYALHDKVSQIKQGTIYTARRHINKHGRHHCHDKDGGHDKRTESEGNDKEDGSYGNERDE